MKNVNWKVVLTLKSPFHFEMLLNEDGDAIAVSDAGPFGFKRPITFRVERTGNGIVLGNAEADLFASGRTLDEALEDLGSEIETAWKEYATGDDSDMDGIARGYRRWLLDNVYRRDSEPFNPRTPSL